MSCTAVGHFVIEGEPYDAQCSLDADHDGDHEHNVVTNEGPLGVVRWPHALTAWPTELKFDAATS